MTDQNENMIDNVNGVRVSGIPQIRDSKGCLRVRKGDLVRVYFHHYSDESQREVVGKVTEVTKRYGLINGGTTQQNPCISLLTAEGDEQYCDVSYVVEVLEKGQLGQCNKNVFAERWYPEGVELLSVKGKKSILCGSLLSLASFFLSKVTYIPLERPIDWQKLVELYEKQDAPGYIGRKGEGVYYVRAKAFGKWVKRNAERICMTVAQIRAEQTQLNIESEKEYWNQYKQDVRYQEMKEADDLLQPESEEQDLDQKSWDQYMQGGLEQDMDLLVDEGQVELEEVVKVFRPVDLPKGTYKCVLCQKIWDGNETFKDPQSIGLRLTCGDLFCGASVRKISDLSKSEYLESLEIEEG